MPSPNLLWIVLEIFVFKGLHKKRKVNADKHHDEAEVPRGSPKPLLEKQLVEKKRKVYAVRRYNGSFCTQKQPEQLVHNRMQQ